MIFFFPPGSHVHVTPIHAHGTMFALFFKHLLTQKCILWQFPRRGVFQLPIIVPTSPGIQFIDREA